MTETSKKVKERQKFDFLKPCPFCGGEVELRDKFDGVDETSFIHCIKCHMWFEKFDWRGYSYAHIIEEWNRRVEEGGRMIEETRDCLNCSASFSDDDENGNMILRCAEHDYKIVDENDCCDEWN